MASPLWFPVVPRGLAQDKLGCLVGLGRDRHVARCLGGACLVALPDGARSHERHRPGDGDADHNGDRDEGLDAAGYAAGGVAPGTAPPACLDSAPCPQC